jgi:hypothetical protein
MYGALMRSSGHCPLEMPHRWYGSTCLKVFCWTGFVCPCWDCSQSLDIPTASHSCLHACQVIYPRFRLASITHTQTQKQYPSGTRKKCPSAHHHCLPGARSHPAAWGGQKLVSGGALHIGRPAVTRLTGVGVKPVVVAAPTLVGQQLTGR